MRRATGCAIGVIYLVGISIHALHEESDSVNVVAQIFLIISIHALHEESDPLMWFLSFL